VVGDHLQRGKAFVAYGPLVLAADEALLGGKEMSLGNLALAGSDAASLGIQPHAAPEKLKTWPGSRVFGIQGIVRRGAAAGSPERMDLIPFADAGAAGTRYQVWLPLAANGAAR